MVRALTIPAFLMPDEPVTVDAGAGPAWSCLRSGRRGARKRKGVWEYTHVRVPHHSRLEAAILACNRASVAAEVAEEDGEVFGQELDPVVPT